MARLFRFLKNTPWFWLLLNALLTAAIASAADAVLFRLAMGLLDDSEYALGGAVGYFLLVSPFLSVCTGVLSVLMTAHVFKRIPLRSDTLVISVCFLLLLLFAKSQLEFGFVGHYISLFFVVVGALVAGQRYLSRT